MTTARPPTRTLGASAFSRTVEALRGLLDGVPRGQVPFIELDPKADATCLWSTLPSGLEPLRRRTDSFQSLQGDRA